MEVLAVVLIMIGIIAFRVISFFYPDWKAIKGPAIGVEDLVLERIPTSLRAPFTLPYS